MATKPSPLPAQTPSDNLPADHLLAANQIERWGTKQALRRQGGLLVVQSAADVQRLAAGKLLAVATERAILTPEQVQRLAELARQYAEEKLQVWLPLNKAGRQRMLKYLQALVPEVFVHVPFTSTTDGGRFADKAPADLTDEDLKRAVELLKQ